MKKSIFIGVILLVLCWPCEGNCNVVFKATITDIRMYQDKNDECFVKVSLHNNGTQRAYIKCSSQYSVYVRDSNYLQRNVTIVVPGYSAIKLIRGKDVPWSSVDMGILLPIVGLQYLKYQNFVDSFTSCVDAKRINGEEYHLCYPNRSIEFYCKISFNSADVQLLLQTLERKKVNIDTIYINLEILIDDQDVVIPVLFQNEYVDFIKKHILK
ncbi:MAG TPA: hypothetical protein VGD89_02040 [Flavipsychrobacter sp.]